jgi:hypothetical protein
MIEFDKNLKISGCNMSVSGFFGYDRDTIYLVENKEGKVDRIFTAFFINKDNETVITMQRVEDNEKIVPIDTVSVSHSSVLGKTLLSALWFKRKMSVLYIETKNRVSGLIYGRYYDE